MNVTYNGFINNLFISIKNGNEDIFTDTVFNLNQYYEFEIPSFLQNYTDSNELSLTLTENNTGIS